MDLRNSDKEINLEEICVCIPVRYQSSRLPGKPLIKLNELHARTVIELTLDRVLESRMIRSKNQIFVFTDDIRIKEVVEKFGIQVFMTDSECQNALVRLSKYVDKLPSKFRAVINLHGDEPFLDTRNLDTLIQDFLHYQQNNILIRQLVNYQEACDLANVKVVMNHKQELMYCSRAVIPHTKDGMIPNSELGIQYYGVVGIHILWRNDLEKYWKNNKGLNYLCEDVEELKLLELGIPLRCVMCPYKAERSLNTREDLEYFRKNLLLFPKKSSG